MVQDSLVRVRYSINECYQLELAYTVIATIGPSHPAVSGL